MDSSKLVTYESVILLHQTLTPESLQQSMKL